MKPLLGSHSIARRLSWQLALVTALLLGAVFACSFVAINAEFREKHAELVESRSLVIKEIVRSAAMQSEAAVLQRIESLAGMRAGTRLELRRADNSLLYRDPDTAGHRLSAHTKSVDFSVETPQVAGGVLRGVFTLDFADDMRLRDRWVTALTIATLAGGALSALGAWLCVRRELKPLLALARQTRAISPGRLHKRLSIEYPAEELTDWIDQFNALLERVEQAYGQLEGFNADVAHELRTPLATLIGQTELALSRERSVETLRETLLSNLEELQRLAAMVNDMLFLSNADRGAGARRGAPVSLATLVHQVVEFHEAPIEDAGLKVRVEGDAQLALDEPLVKRALSNLLGNATRFAERGSVLRVCITPEGAEQVVVMVENAGPQIEPEHLPRLFDRFFRADVSRCEAQQHHGLGLAIVAAIARMHAGQALAECSGGRTRIGFRLQAG